MLVVCLTGSCTLIGSILSIPVNKGLGNGYNIISSALENIYKLASRDTSGCEIYKNSCCSIIMGIGRILIVVVICMMNTLISDKF